MPGSGSEVRTGGGYLNTENVWVLVFPFINSRMFLLLCYGTTFYDSAMAEITF